MEMTPVITPDGQPVFSAGGRHAYRTHQHKGFVVSLEWVGRNSRKAQPCMVIWPATNVFVPGASTGMWVIGRRAITQFVGFTSADRCTGGPSEHCWREARAALPMLGKDINDRAALHALVDTVVRFAPDLVLMPVTPRHVRDDLDGEAMWDLVVRDKNSGRVLHETEA